MGLRNVSAACRVPRQMSTHVFVVQENRFWKPLGISSRVNQHTQDIFFDPFNDRCLVV